MTNANYNWKNFKLGTELQIAGSFIYNSLHVFDRMKSLYYEEECFEFLYNASVGIERLQKILLILLHNMESENQSEFEASLKTHSHIQLMNRINALIKVEPPASNIKFLLVLTNFYRHTRYSRYRLENALKDGEDRNALIKFIKEELGIVIDNESLMPTPLDKRMKEFVAKIIGQISSMYYESIVVESRRNNMYTYEMTSGSKAHKIFVCQEYTFELEHQLKREIFTFLLHQDISDGLIRLVKELTPLPFENNSTDDFVRTLVYDDIDRSMIDEMKYIYEEHPFGKDRIETINVIGEGFDFGDYGDVGDQINS